MFRSLSNPCRIFSIITFLSPISPVLALLRTIGPVGDSHFRKAVAACDATNPARFEFGQCSHLVDCIYDNVTEAFKASLSSGTNIVSLLPTILVLTGYPPLELVELALLSPHRAIAACCFGIGLHSGLFRQLRPGRLQHSHSDVVELRVREWTVFLPSIGSSRWQHRLAKLIVDALIVALLGVMLWRNLEVASYTMIPWRCEYTYMLLAWPIACIVWLVISVALLLCIKETIDIYNPADIDERYTRLGLMLLPYKICSPKEEAQAPQNSDQIEMERNITASTCPEYLSPSENSTSSCPSIASKHTKSPASTAAELNDAFSVPRSSNCVTIRITMPSIFGWRSWRWYEAVIETTAVGVYLYATFVLTSLIFLNADRAIVYATVMALCLSAVRILTVLF